MEAEPRRTLLSRIGVRRLAAGAAAALLVAVVAFALVTGLDGSSKPVRQHPALQAGAAQRTRANGSNPSGGAAIGTSAPVPATYWLGMQILSTPLGAVVTTVALGSEGDRDGFYPGDAISAIDSTQIDSVPQLRAALQSVPIGQLVRVTITRGSGTLTAYLKLTKRPTNQP